MSVKSYLRMIKRYEIRIEQKKFQLAGLGGDIDYLRGIDYARDRVQTSPRDTMPEQVIRMIELEKKLLGEIAEFNADRDTIIRQIQEMDNTTFSELLFKRYVERKKFELIAVEMHYDYGSVRNMHGQALEAFGDRFPEAREFRVAGE